MANWREDVLHEFVPGVARLTLTEDPNELLIDAEVQTELERRGFGLLTFGDPGRFRHAYESEFRSFWDRGERLDRSLVVRTERTLEELPFDLLERGRQVTVSLETLLPSLSAPVLRALDREDVDAVYGASPSVGTARLGDNETKDWLLEHLFRIDAERVRTPEDLLEVLVRRHRGRGRIPPVLDDRLIAVLRGSGRFNDWPLDRLVRDRAIFLRFLQERWPHFLDAKVHALAGQVRAPATPYLEIEGPTSLPLDLVRDQIDTLFLEGALHPVGHDDADRLTNDWVRIGVRTDPRADRMRRIRRLLDATRKGLPGEGATARDWLGFAGPWAELTALVGDGELDAELVDGMRAIRSDVDTALLAWLGARYGSLYSQPRTMVHHVPGMLARKRQEGQGRVALVVVDGLSLAHWTVLRGAISAGTGTQCEEGSLFAWIPTITSVSRQALFAGRLPKDLRDLGTTAREEPLWRAYWEDAARGAKVVYLKGLGGSDSMDRIDDTIDSRTAVLGLVVDTVDKLVHGDVLGMRTLQDHIRSWGRDTFSGIVIGLLDRGFAVYLSSDHGSIEAMGIGRPKEEGVLVEQRGARARIYPNGTLRAQVAGAFPAAITWPPIGLPDNVWALLAPDRQAFVQEGTREIGHGGATIDEVVVPFVEIKKGDA